ncbi:MAG: FxsA family protein [marine benthic group bacterium]|nr:FxsA family protein [Candidatus Benthicola marisminoris]
MFRLILLFTLVPLLELSLLLRIGAWLGTWPTVWLVIVTGVIGAWLARREGVRTWQRVRAEAAAGRVPGEGLLHALLVFLAGVVLVTPGVLTDAAGLLLLFRPTREIVARRIRKRLAGQVEMRTVGLGGEAPGWSGRASSPPPDDAGGAREGGRVIEIEAE